MASLESVSCVRQIDLLRPTHMCTAHKILTKTNHTITSVHLENGIDFPSKKHHANSIVYIDKHTHTKERISFHDLIVCGIIMIGKTSAFAEYYIFCLADWVISHWVFLWVNIFGCFESHLKEEQITLNLDRAHNTYTHHKNKIYWMHKTHNKHCE